MAWFVKWISIKKLINKFFSIDSRNNYLDNLLSHDVMHSGGDITRVDVFRCLFFPLPL